MEAKSFEFSEGKEKMITVRINGEVVDLNTAGLARITDLVELIKASIDPDHIITGLRLDGNELEDADWQLTIAQVSGRFLEVETGTPARYAAERLNAAADIINKCFAEFRTSRKLFQSGDMRAGNQKLIEATNALRAFFSWYGTMVEIVPEEKRSCFNISTHVSKISETCKRICQQQLYQSWWALGETLQRELEPELDELEDICRKNFKSSGMAAHISA